MQNKINFSKLSLFKKNLFAVILIFCTLIFIFIDLTFKIKRNKIYLETLYIYSHSSINIFYYYLLDNDKSKTIKILTSNAAIGNWLFPNDNTTKIYFTNEIVSSPIGFQNPIEINEIDKNIAEYKKKVSSEFEKIKFTNNNNKSQIRSEIINNYYSQKKIILIFSDSKKNLNNEVENILQEFEVFYSKHNQQCIKSQTYVNKFLKNDKDNCIPIIYREPYKGHLQRYNYYFLIFFYFLLLSGICISIFYKKNK
jgi:hypothetical protein